MSKIYSVEEFSVILAERKRIPDDLLANLEGSPLPFLTMMRDCLIETRTLAEQLEVAEDIASTRVKELEKELLHTHTDSGRIEEARQAELNELRNSLEKAQLEADDLETSVQELDRKNR
ncbi:MAG: hypothetical protein AAF497_00640, partial [Planctomycetota bacterium]